MTEAKKETAKVVTTPKEEPKEEKAPVVEDVASTDSDEEAQKQKEFEEFLANR